MSVKPHLLDREEVLEYCMTDNWAWVCTNQRFLKYRESDGGTESLSDVSYDEISGITLTSEPKNTSWLIGAIISGVISLLGFAGGDPGVLVAGFIFLLITIALAWKWSNSDSSYFELKGSGLLHQEPEEWRIQNSAESKDDVREFVKSLRAQL